MKDKEQRDAFIERYHHLIFDFMRRKRLDDEFYDLLALGLMEAAKEYNPQKIRDPKGFVIFKLKRAIYHYYEYVYALKRRSFQTRVAWLDVANYSGVDSTRQIEDRMFLEEVFSADWITDQEKFYIRCLAIGINPTEIAERTNENFFTVRTRIGRMREKVRNFYYKGIIPEKEYVPAYMDYIFCPQCQHTFIWQKGIEVTKHGDNIKFECGHCHKQFHVPADIIFDPDRTGTFLSIYKIYRRPVYMDYIHCPSCQGAEVVSRGTKTDRTGTIKKNFMCKSCGKYFSVSSYILDSPELLTNYLNNYFD